MFHSSQTEGNVQHDISAEAHTVVAQMNWKQRGWQFWPIRRENGDWKQMEHLVVLQRHWSSTQQQGRALYPVLYKQAAMLTIADCPTMFVDQRLSHTVLLFFTLSVITLRALKTRIFSLLTDSTINTDKQFFPNSYVTTLQFRGGVSMNMNASFIGQGQLQ